MNFLFIKKLLLNIFQRAQYIFMSEPSVVLIGSLDYLVKFYSPIRINTATAKELESVLDVPSSVAEAIVTYRQAQGPFRTVDDLTRVPGLEPEKIDARKARLTFLR